MALSSKESAILISKLSWMPFFPKGDESGVGALVDALIDCSRNVSHAESTISYIQQNDERAPMPARIRSAALDTLTGKSGGHCETCSGTGWIYPAREPSDGCAIQSVRRCQCVKGAA